MTPTIELKDCNLVIVANTFNVSIINPVWLFKNNIFTEEELNGATSLPVMVDIATETFNLNLIPERLQLSIRPAVENKKELILAKIGKLIEALPHTPFIAAGLNFTYHVIPEDKDVGSLTRSLFCNTQSKLFEGLEASNVRFGGYISQDVLDMRYRLEAKPVARTKSKKTQEVLSISHNFNKNITHDDDHNMVLNIINKWDDAKEIAQKTTNKIKG